MKNVLKPMLSIVVLCATMCAANAQETIIAESTKTSNATNVVQNEEFLTDEVLGVSKTTANKLRAERGQKIANAGKTLMISGGAVALTSTVFYAIARAEWDKHYNPETPTMPTFPIVTLAGYAAGAVLTLVGIPIFCAGWNIVESNGGQFISMRDNTNGTMAMFDLGFGGPFVSLDAVAGYNYNSHIFVGGGIGSKMWLIPGLARDGVLASLPVYGQVRHTLGNKRIAPYAALSGGYDIVAGAPYFGVDFGTRISSSRTTTSRYGDSVKRDSSWWISSKLSWVYDDDYLLSISIAKSF